MDRDKYVFGLFPFFLVSIINAVETKDVTKQKNGSQERLNDDQNTVPKERLNNIPLSAVYHKMRLLMVKILLKRIYEEPS